MRDSTPHSNSTSPERELELVKQQLKTLTSEHQKLLDAFTGYGCAKTMAYELEMANLIVEKSPVVLFRRKTGHPGLTYMSQNISRFGYKAEDFIENRMEFSDIIFPDDMTRVMEEVLAYAEAEQEAYTQVYRIVAKDGGIHWIEDQTSAIRDESGKITFYQGVLIDITERKLAEEEVMDANRRIMASIRYAKIIQRSLLPDLETLRHKLPGGFVIWEPRDIVGGDIYFVEHFEDGIILAVVDCTGHGVPGAFMTMIASSGLRRITVDDDCKDPAEILRRLNIVVRTSLQQDSRHSRSNDGLDAAVCHVTPERVVFSGARLPMVYVENGQAHVIKGDRASIGYKGGSADVTFTSHRVRATQDTRFYLFTDGLTDQLGGPDRRMFGRKRFCQLLLEIHHLPFAEQRRALLERFRAYQADHERLDDLTVVGFGFGR